MALLWLVVMASSIWMGVDSAKLGYDQREVPGFSMSPAGWFFVGLLLWFVAFPLYLTKRTELKASGEARRLRLRAGMGMLPPGNYGQPGVGLHGQPQYGGQPQPVAPANPYGTQPPQPVGQPPAPAYGAPVHQAPVPDQIDLASEIIKLAAMRDQGLLTDDEFRQQKSKLLNRA